MDAVMTEKEINEVQKLRAQASAWRWGTGLLTTFFVVGCLISINNSVQGLFHDGPRQREFVSTLSSNVQRDVAPTVQTIAAQTLAETRPQVEAAFGRVNQRMPELAQASYSEFEQLHTSLPEKGQRILGDTFATMIAQKEEKLKTMFPEATDENIHALATNLTDLAQVHAVSVNDKLFGPHQVAMNNIVTHMEQIRLDESKKPESAMGSNWEMGLAVLDVVRDDLRDMETIAAAQAKKTNNNSVADTKATAVSASMPMMDKADKEAQR